MTMIKVAVAAVVAGFLFVSGLQSLQADFQTAMNDRASMIDAAAR